MKGFFASSEVQKAKPQGLIPRCGSCGLFKTCKSPKMPVYGDGRKGVLVIGEAPGETEDEENRPFVGKAGKHLRSFLSGIGVSLDKDTWTTNALICRPPRNATPDDKQISYCRPNILACIAEYRPNVILTLGRVALESVITQYWKGDVGPMERWAGWKIPLEKHWIIPTFHPSYLLRMENRLLDRLFEQHLEQAFEIDSAPPKQPEYEKQVERLYDSRDIIEALDEIDSAGGWAGVDYETNCLKPEYPKARILSFSVSHRERTIAYPWHGDAIRATGRFLASDRTRKVASNMKMEERWTLKTFGHGVANWGWDTMLAAHSLDNRQGICSLKFQAFVKMGIPSYNWNIEPYLESIGGSHYNREAEIAIPTLLLYNGLDSLFERILAQIQRKEMGYAP